MKNAKRLWSLILGLAPAAVALGQQPVQHRCWYDHAVEQREQEFPGYRAAVQAAFEQARRVGAELQGARSTYTVPVAVHVVWKEPAERLPECKIIEQIQVLNEDYKRLNADAGQLRPAFQGLAANPEVTFRLDTIIWKQTSTLFYSSGPFPDLNVTNKVKKSAEGGSDALPTSGHLNIWLCNMGNGGVLGFAYPPAGLSHWPANSQAPTPEEDGVVVDYRVVGRSGTYSVQGQTLNTQGRTCTHEVGHYLGLRHIWGDGFSSIFGIPDCNADDGVGDTPNQGLQSNFACNPNQNTCNDGAGDLPDMIENFMDYSSENCQNTFTQGQVSIMHGVLTSERAGLAQTPAPTAQRPTNDALPEALALPVNLDAACNSVLTGSTSGATPSVFNPCSAGQPNDVWYSFTAPQVGLVFELSGLSASDTLTYELFQGDCGALQSLFCRSTASAVVNTTDFAALSQGTRYYLRLASAAGMSATLCLRTVQDVSPVVDSEAWKSALRLYPNPSADGSFWVELPSLPADGSLRLYNALGQPLGTELRLQAQPQGQTLRMDLSAQPAGLYWLEWRSEEGSAVFPMIKS